ncbi:MAG: YIP1 family protein [Methanospirillaceae archaeon]|nr:YIP1 family protein [Methanospirillaceae archaeon]
MEQTHVLQPVRFFISTLVSVLISPKKTIKARAKTELCTAFLYYIVLCGIMVFLGIFVLFTDQVISPGFSFAYQGYMLLVCLGIFIAPQFPALGILMITTRIFRGNSGISETCKAFFYGLTPSVFLMPILLLLRVTGRGTDPLLFLGVLVVFVFWSGYLIYLGLKEFHQISSVQSFCSVFSCLILIIILSVGFYLIILMLSSPPYPPYGPALNVERIDDQYLITFMGGPDLSELESIGIYQEGSIHTRIPLAIQVGATCTVPVRDIGETVTLAAQFKDGTMAVVYDKNFDARQDAVLPSGTPLPLESQPKSPPAEIERRITLQSTPLYTSENKTIILDVSFHEGSYLVRNIGGEGNSLVDTITVCASGSSNSPGQFTLKTKPGSSVQITNAGCGKEVVVVTAQYKDGSSKDYGYYWNAPCNGVTYFHDPSYLPIPIFE